MAGASTWRSPWAISRAAASTSKAGSDWICGTARAAGIPSARRKTPGLSHHHLLPRLRGHAALGREDAAQIERIGGRDPERPGPLRAPALARGSLAAQAPEHFHRLGARELLAREALHETPAANLTAQLELPVDAHQITPRQRHALALQ